MLLRRRPAPVLARGPAVVVGALMVLAAVVAVTLRHRVFPALSDNHDEAVYLIQARMLAAGDLTLPLGPTTEFFRPWMSGPVGDHLVMVFPPVLPALLAVGMLGGIGVPGVLAVIAAAGAGLAFLAGWELTGDRRAGLAAAAMLVVTPLFVIQSGLALTYVLALDLELSALVLLHRGVRVRRAGWLVGGGAALGLLAFARPYDAVLVGGPLAAVAVLEARRVATMLSRAGWIVLGALPFGLASLTYNLAVTGSPWRIPLEAAGGDNAFGFGERNIAAGTPRVRYDLATGVSSTLKNVAALPGWLPGGVALVALALLGVAVRRRSRWTWALVALTVMTPLGYTLYWGNLLVVIGAPSIGPHYYLSVLIPLVVLGGLGWTTLWRRRPLIAVAVALGMVLHSGVSLDQRLDVNRRLVAAQRREQALIDSARLRDAIVVLPAPGRDGGWIGHPRPSFLNDPQLRGPVLFAVDRAGETLRLFDDFGDRDLYRLLARRGVPDPAARPAPVLWPIDRVAGTAVDVPVRVVNTDGRPVVTVDVTDGKQSRRFVLDQHSGPGRAYDVTWRLEEGSIGLRGGDGAPVAGPSGELTALRGSGTVAVGVEFGAVGGAPGAGARVESRFWYRMVGGRVELVTPGEPWTKDGAGPWLDWDGGGALHAAPQPAPTPVTVPLDGSDWAPDVPVR